MREDQNDQPMDGRRKVAKSPSPRNRSVSVFIFAMKLQFDAKPVWGINHPLCDWLLFLAGQLACFVFGLQIAEDGQPNRPINHSSIHSISRGLREVALEDSTISGKDGGSFLENHSNGYHPSGVSSALLHCRTLYACRHRVGASLENEGATGILATTCGCI